MATIYIQIDRAHTIINFDFYWKYHLKFLGNSTSCFCLYFWRAHSIQEPILFKNSCTDWFRLRNDLPKWKVIPTNWVMREKEERVLVLGEGRKGGVNILIQTELVYNESTWYLCRQITRVWDLWSKNFVKMVVSILSQNSKRNIIPLSEVMEGKHGLSFAALQFF